MPSRRTLLALGVTLGLVALIGAVVVPLLLPGDDSGDADAVVDPNAPVVAFYGDSYTLGTGASDPAERWSTRIAEDRGWTEFNPSVNGLGFVNNRQSFDGDDLPALIIAEDPDIVFVTMGLNDNFSYDRAAADIETQITRDFDRLTEGLPDARFIVVEPFWYTEERPDSVETIIGWVRDAAAAIDADYIPGASTWIRGQDEFMAPDGLHPNDAGYAHMAELMDAALVDLGL
ncbi:SGNH/GDSL hydrolase family protein [Marisediminicola sp. LYQ134]|uniref:SGNH/GDSL hydrolase family protein n=1 Tax=Marisediminicola sp. LYQ134 TaxID=3391061 RepID=UPI0039837F7F